MCLNLRVEEEEIGLAGLLFFVDSVFEVDLCLLDKSFQGRTCWTGLVDAKIEGFAFRNALTGNVPKLHEVFPGGTHSLLIIHTYIPLTKK